MKSVRQYLVEEIALTLDRRPEKIDMDVPFSRMGIKSMDLVAITARLANDIRRDLPSTLGFDYPSISAVASFLEKESDESRGNDSKGYSIPVQPSWYKSDESPEDGDESVAVVGIGLKFPGGSNTPAAFWNFLAGSGDAITRVPGNRWRLDDFLDTDPAAPGKMTTPWGGFLDDIDQFDPEFFGISPREAQGIDPQQRLLLEVGWNALEDAGIDPSKLRGGNTGVFVGISGSDYGRLLFKDVERLDLYSGTGSSTAIAANRLSYFLGLRGPSLAVDTACSSSLVTVDLACRNLKNRTCDLALAGGVNLILSPEMTIIFSKAGLMANDGRCKTFDASADGYVRSEGCGIVALKRLSSAIKDKNRIYGVIRGSYINQDGESNGLTVPNGVAQEMLIRSSLKQAGIAPHEVGYAETHGTGTSIGDPIEVRSLGRVLGKGRKSPLVIGSVKTNIGHLEQAAGIASLIKVLLSFKNEMIPAHLHFNELNPLISLDEIPAKIPVEPVPWPANAQKRIATVSGFSFGGVNAHMVVEEPPAMKAPADGSRPGVHLLTLSARDKSTLDELTDEYLTFLEQHPEIDSADFCYTANAGRRDFRWRAAVAGKDSQELVKGLQRLKNNDLSLDAWKTVQGVSPRNPAFLFTGQGSQYPGMGQELYALQPVFREQMDKCNAILTQYHSISLNHLIYEQNDPQLINQTVNTQPALFSIEYAMAQMYRSWGIEPAFVMGHSVGEFVAACVAGVFSLADGLKLISARGRLIQDLPKEGKMVVCLCALDLVEELKAPYGNDLSIAAVNGPSNTVVSGKSVAVDGICKLLEQNGISWVPLQTSHAFHSVLMEPMIQAFKEVAETVRYESPKIPYISNVTGEIIENDEVCSPDYWCRHILSAVLFDAGVRTLYNKGCNLFLEVGPNPVLSGMASAILPKETAVFAPSLRRGMSDEKMLLSGMGPLYTNGVNIDWCKQAAPFSPSIVSIPHYPFRRRRCWFEEDGPSKGFHPSGGTRINTALGGILYEYTCQGSSFYMTDHRVYGHGVMSGSTLVAMAFSKLPEVLGSRDCFLESYFVLEPLYIPEEAAFTLQLIFKWIDDQRLSFEIFSNDLKEGQENWTRHAQGEAGVNPAGSQPKNSFAPEEIKKRCSGTIDPDRLYEDLWNGGLELGRRFKWIEQIWRCDGEAFALMRLPADAEESCDDELPPGLIDSCIQTIFACLDFDKNNAYMFLGIDQLRFYGPASGRLYCHMVLQTGVEDQDLMVGNYQFWTETGQLIAEAKGVHVKRVQRDALSFLTAKKKDRKSLYDIHWKIKDRTNISAQHAGSWLIFAENRADGDVLSSALKTRHMTHSVICLDSDAHPWPDFDTLEMQMAPFEFSNIIYCGKGKNWETKESFSDCAAVLSLVQWLSQRNVTAKLWLLTRNAQQPDMDYSNIDPLSAMLWGLGKVIALEHPELFGGVIDLPYELHDPVVDRLMAELTRPQDEKIMSIRGKECYVPRLQHLESDGREAEAKEIRGDASYMITGGTGGLGLGLARWLGQKGAGHIVLTGRRSPSKKAEKNINDLEKEGVRIQFIRCDVSNGVSLAAVFKEIAGTLPPLKGVFHLAGVVDDGLITRLNWDRFSTVINPKVSGTRNLHHLTRNLDLDYFVMFSSVVSLLGSPGQSSYAAANSFMDALAFWRRNAGLPALVINWGPWKGPGMTGRLGQADQNRWERSGFELLDPETSFSQLGTLLSGSAVRAAVIDADWNTYIRNNLGSSVVPMLSELVKGTAAVKEPVPSPVSAGSLDALKNVEPDMRGTLARELIAKLVAEVMWMEDTFHIDPNVSLMESGLDSLMAMELRSRFRKDWGVDLTLADFLKTPTMETLVQTLLSGIEGLGAGDVNAAGYPQVVPDPGHRYDPFPLTDVQQAYWMGRSGGLVLGDVSCHVYPEVSVKKLDVKRLEKAVKRLMERHETLRLVVSQEGTQRILEAVPDYHIPVQDLRGWAPDRADQAIAAVRERMDSQILDSENGLLFEIQASLLDEHTRLHISFDLLIGDGWSFGILIRDLYQYYLDPQANLPPLELTFRDYVLAQEKMKETDIYRESLEYWQQRLPNLPGPPDLPLRTAPEALDTQKFIRKSGRLNENQWNNLKKLGARAGLTPSGLLLAAFCDVLAVWSKSPDFTINLTMFNRFPLHEQVNQIVGDFTTLTLLEVHIDEAQPFEKRAGDIQQQLWRDLEYQQVTGVEVLRQMARQRGRGSELNFPVVFTSVLPYSGAGNEGTSIGVPGALGLNLEYCVSQTPQVWLDHQIFEQDGKLIFNWDLVDNLFPPGMIEDMFDAYCGLIERLAQDPAEWKQTGLNLIPQSHVRLRKAVNNTIVPVSDDLLHSAFFRQADRNPNRDALVTAERRMTYNELALRAEQTGLLLQNKGVGPNDLVAVIMGKGWEQVVAVMGILWAGAAYLPVDPGMPKARLDRILANGDIRLALIQSRHRERINWPGDVKWFAVDEMEVSQQRLPFNPIQGREDLAYVIYTSGSTGIPKGVMIDHRGAVNTIADINRRFDVGPDDSILGLAELSFDLSVYDIFGILGAGGRLVLPDFAPVKDPSNWLELMKKEGVTLWNSVPQLMQMLIETVAGDSSSALPDPLRLIMLSGDRIPVDLPEKIRARFQNTRIVSLGGATEASIWSILHPIETVEPEGKSIPYGKPMDNQQFYVLNRHLEPCPDWVTGDLYIGGIGLAKGYRHDEENTQKNFLIHPASNIPLYRTGDLGRYLPDGTIEFQGREDYQVKIGGYRIECGEIEAALNSYPGIRASVVHAAAHDSDKEKYLVAYLVVSNNDILSVPELKTYLQQKIPEYMVPLFFEILDQLPITANGKIDRKLLPAPKGILAETPEQSATPANEIEQQVLEIIGKAARVETISVNHNFFDLGINSLQLVEVRSLIKEELSRDVNVVDLFRYSTIRSLAKFLSGGKKDPRHMDQADQIAVARKAKRGRRRQAI
nr:non-ribosomal peptide synthetase/type I polyketide synthase [uncultured Desulfobacter sp.]